MDATLTRPSADVKSRHEPTSGLRVLHLEDNLPEAEAVQMLIAREFPGARHTVVTNRPAFVGELRQQSCDLILADYSQAAFDGFEALALSRAFAPQVPFIFYSGDLGDDRAGEALARGAQDCVPKGHFRRLGAALHRVLDLREERQLRHVAEQRISQLELELRESRQLTLSFADPVERIRRLEDISLLATGSAHELNNILAPIFMAVPMLRDAAETAEARALLDTVERSAHRGADLVAQVLAFATADRAAARRLQAEAIVEEVAAFARATFPCSITVESTIDASIAPVKAFPAQLRHALLSLCTNAREAMPNGGVLSLVAENCRIDELPADCLPFGRVGAFVRLRVEDTGCGINPELLAKVWEPLAAARLLGKETSLGLPTVRSIVKRHGGFLQLQTQEGMGTSCRIYLPVAADSCTRLPLSTAPF